MSLLVSSAVEGNTISDEGDIILSEAVLLL